MPSAAKASKNPNKNNLPWSWFRTRELRIPEIWGWRRRFSPKLSTAAIWYGFQRQPFKVFATAASVTVRIPVEYANSVRLHRHVRVRILRWSPLDQLGRQSTVFGSFPGNTGRTGTLGPIAADLRVILAMVIRACLLIEGARRGSMSPVSPRYRGHRNYSHC
jgi:hypothetical protein